MNSGEHVSLLVRRGYWAPKHAEDALAASKQEIENAVFSRDEIHNLPVEMHTQVLKAGSEAKLNVLTSVDLKLIHLRKADDRNRNDLTIVAAVFDANGNFIAGAQKIPQASSSRRDRAEAGAKASRHHRCDLRHAPRRVPGPAGGAGRRRPTAYGGKCTVQIP
jgi:hypothetical protein